MPTGSHNKKSPYKYPDKYRLKIMTAILSHFDTIPDMRNKYMFNLVIKYTNPLKQIVGK